MQPVVVKNPIMDALVLSLRDPATSSAGFRTALRRVGSYLGYEIARSLPTKEAFVTTPLGAASTQRVLADQPVIVAILRAGTPLMEGLLDAFPGAEAGYVGAARDERTLQPTLSYAGVPSLDGKTLILADTMIATGGSIVATFDLLKRYGSPTSTVLVGALAAQPGIERIVRERPDVFIYLAALDPGLNNEGYIVPGLGDAGDRSFGAKKG
jgi:uracil phosphoribosyltransferase